ncbi:hypothetical protein ACFY93_33395 [Streptomyces sp. NPDC008313]|uniref:hypothetical protein n=1 Tax=Streptomyces sp. NPDC008313 TaxID=3364826 RepID=UPI0036E35435
MSPFPAGRLVAAVALSCSLLAGTTACGNDKDTSSSATPTSSAEKQKFAKTRFVANAGLAAGATYQWIVKPWKAGKFKKGADGRTGSLIKAGLAGAFTYNRLNAALKNAKSDPTLAKAVAPLTASVDKLKDLPSKLRKGDSDSAAKSFDDVVNDVKEAGKSAGADVKEEVPSLSDLKSGS